MSVMMLRTSKIRMDKSHWESDLVAFISEENKQWISILLVKMYRLEYMKDLQ